MNVLDNPANAEVVAYLRQKASPNLIANIAPHSEFAYTDHTHLELADLLDAASRIYLDATRLAYTVSTSLPIHMVWRVL